MYVYVDQFIVAMGPEKSYDGLKCYVEDTKAVWSI